MFNSYSQILLDKFHFTTFEDFGTFPKSEPKPSPYNLAALILSITILFLGVTVVSYTLWKINSTDDVQPTPILTDEELKSLMLSIVNDEFEKLFSEGDRDNLTSFIGELQLLDNNFHVLWSKDLNDTSLRDLDKERVALEQDTSSEEISSEKENYSR